MFKKLLNDILTIVNPLLPLVVVLLFVLGVTIGGAVLFTACILSNIMWVVINMDEIDEESSAVEIVEWS